MTSGMMDDRRAINYMAEEWLNFVKADSTGFRLLMNGILDRIKEIESDQEETP